MDGIKNSDKRLLEQYDDFCEQIAIDTKDDALKKETTAQKRRRKKELLQDYEKFCKFYFNSYCTAPMGKFHLEIAQDIFYNPRNIFLLQLSREFGKSTHAGFLLPMFLKFNGMMTGMLMGSANETLASELILDIQANLDANERILNDFGTQKRHGRWELGNFATKDNCFFKAFGVKQSPRGAKYKGQRPTYGCIDDLNDKKSVRNDRISQEHYEWVKEDFMPALATKNWSLVIPQNKFHKNTITAKFEEDKEIQTKLHKVNITDDKGNSSWPEHFTDEDCAGKIKSLGFLSAQRELFNNPIVEGTTFKKDWFVFAPRIPYKEFDKVVGYYDPSYKNTHKSDYKACVIVGKKGHKYQCGRVFLKKTSINNMFEWGYIADNEAGDTSLISHHMEANFIQEMHFDALNAMLEKKGRRLRITGDKRKKPDKFHRITSLSTLFEFGLITFAEDLENDKDTLLLINQFLAIEKGSNTNDDGPDAFEGAIFILDNDKQKTEPPTIIKTLANIRRKIF